MFTGMLAANYQEKICTENFLERIPNRNAKT